MWKTSAADATTPSLGGEGGGIISVAEAQPEIHAMMKQIAKQHWESWYDLPVPALNDMTPREASRTEEGRDLLQSLLQLFENH